MKFTPHNYNNPNAATYAQVKEKLELHFQNMKMEWAYDVADSISNMELVDLAALKPVKAVVLPDATIEDVNDREAHRLALQNAEDLEHSIRLKLHINREQQLTANMRTAYSTIIAKFCSKTMVQ